MKCLIHRLIEERIKTLFVFMLALLVAACSDSEYDDIALASGEQQGIEIPDVLLQRAIAASGTMEARLYCDEVSHTMTITGGTANGKCTVPSTTNPHTVRVEFWFTSSIYDDTYQIARVETTWSESDGPVDFELVNYDMSMDDDQDHVTNLEELEGGANPGDASCFLGVSLIGHCTL